MVFKIPSTQTFLRFHQCSGAARAVPPGGSRGKGSAAGPGGDRCSGKGPGAGPGAFPGAQGTGRLPSLLRLCPRLCCPAVGPRSSARPSALPGWAVHGNGTESTSGAPGGLGTGRGRGWAGFCEPGRHRDRGSIPGRVPGTIPAADDRMRTPFGRLGRSPVFPQEQDREPGRLPAGARLPGDAACGLSPGLVCPAQGLCAPAPSAWAAAAATSSHRGGTWK